MKDWVKPYILQETGRHLDGFVKNRLEREQWLALKSKALENTEILFHELTSCLNCHFGREPGDPQVFFYKVFGSVLADLPEEVFEKLSCMKNLFFTHNPNPGGEAKIFELGDDILQGNQEIVTFSYDSGFLPPKVLRGEIVQKFLQIYTGRSNVYEQDPQIHSIAIEWGFGEEIKAVRKYKNEARYQKRTRLSVIRKRVIASSIQQSPVLIMREEKGGEKRVYELTRSVTSIGRHPADDWS
ncbi:MAG: hypothetical protein GTO12_20755 [Proteobacteria bacterium]|nr:hypothetical protein [Pseudomonadota bacterium]